jgi:hypothetical protein
MLKSWVRDASDFWCAHELPNYYKRRGKKTITGSKKARKQLFSQKTKISGPTKHALIQLSRSVSSTKHQ